MRKINERLKVTEKEMLDALARSGYLLEAQIARQLSQAGFFVETNQIVEDPISGKGREIDIVAEYYDRDKPRDSLKACAKIEFVFEVKNNLFPLVLLNDFEFTPRVEDFFGLKEITTTPENIKYSGFDEFYDPLINQARSGIYSQYCSFHKKKSNEELMALHPDNVHSSLSKIIQYCQESMEAWEEREQAVESDERYFRRFLYMPILLLNDDLYEMKDQELVKVQSSILVINYHHKRQKHMAYVFVVTKAGLGEFISNSLNVEASVEAEMKQHLITMGEREQF